MKRVILFLAIVCMIHYVKCPKATKTKNVAVSTHMRNLHDQITGTNVKNYLGIGGTYEFLRQTVSRGKLIESDHWPPNKMYEYAKDDHIKKLTKDQKAALSLDYTFHREFSTTGAKVNKDFQNLAQDKISHQTFFAEALKDCMKEGNYKDAVYLSILEYENVMSEHPGRFEEMKPGIIQGLDVHEKNKLITKQQKEELIQQFKLDKPKVNIELTAERKKVFELQDEFTAFKSSCRKTRSIGGACLIRFGGNDGDKVRKISPSDIDGPEKPVNPLSDGNQNLKNKVGQDGSTNLIYATELKEKIKSGAMVDGLYQKTPAIGDIDFDRVQIGKGTFRKSIKERAVKFKDKFVHGAKKFGRGFLKKSQKVTGKFGQAFLLRSLGKGIIDGDYQSLGITVGLVGISHLGDKLTTLGKSGKGLWKINSNIVKNAGKVLGTAVDVIGIGFDFYSIIESAKCLQNTTKNEKNCEEENKYLKASEINETAILIILANSTCQHEGEICGGRDAVLDIITSTISIGLSAVSIACPPCAVVTVPLDLIIQGITAAFQAQKQVELFDSVIKLTKEEKRQQWWRFAFSLSATRYLANLKKQKEANNNLVNQLSSFLIQNPQVTNIVFQAIIVEDCNCQKPLKSKIIQGIGDSIFGKRCETCSRSIEITRIDLDKREKMFTFSYLARWSPEIKIGRLFCPPLSNERIESTTREIRADESYCYGALGVEYLRNDTRLTTILNLGEVKQGDHIAFGFANSPNVFIFTDGNVNFLGGEKDDVFIFKGCSGIAGTIIGRGGFDTLDASEPSCQDNKRVTIDFENGVARFGSDSLSLNLDAIENFVGSSTTSETVKCDCGTTMVKTNGGRGRGDDDQDFIRINSANCTHKLQIHVGSHTLVENFGQGSFHYFISDGDDIEMRMGSKVNAYTQANHQLTLLFSYLEISQIEISMPEPGLLLNHTSGAGGSIHFSYANFENVSFTTKAFPKKLIPAAQLQLRNDFKTYSLLFHLSPEDFDGDYMTPIRGHAIISNIFNIFPNTWLYITGGDKDDIFVIQGPMNGSLDGGGGVNTLDFSAYKTDDKLIVDFVQGIVKLSENEFRINLRKFQIFNGRGVHADTVICSCDNKYVESGGEIQIPSSGNCSYNLQISLKGGAQVLNTGRGYVGYFVALEDGVNINISRDGQIKESIHEINFLFDVQEFLDIRMVGNTLEIVHKLGIIRISAEDGIFNMAATVTMVIQSNPIPAMLVNENGELKFLFQLKPEDLKGQGHPSISNLFIIPPDVTLTNLEGGLGNDTFVIRGPSQGHLLGGEGLNTLDFSQMFSNLSEFIQINLFRKLINYGQVVTMKIDGGFNHVIGRSNEPEIVITDCHTAFVDLSGGPGGNFTDFVLVPKDSCRNDELTLNIVFRKNMVIFNDAEVGIFNYLLYTSDFEDYEFSVYCFNSLCSETVQTVHMDIDITDIEEFGVSKNSVFIRLGGSIHFTFTLKPAIEFEFPMVKNLPKEFTEMVLNISNSYPPVRAPDSEDIDTSNDAVYFNFKFNDGVELYLNHMGLPTAIRHISSCSDILEIIQMNQYYAVRFGATFVITRSCDSSISVIIIGGDEHADFLENEPKHVTHLVGNEGMESIFVILPSPEKYDTYIYIINSHSSSARNILDLSNFYDKDGTSENIKFPEIMSDDHENLIFVMEGGQRVIFFEGVTDYPYLNVVVRYSQLEIEHTISDGLWLLVQPPLEFPEEKEVVIISVNDDLDLPSVVTISNRTTSSDSIFKLENDSLVVTNMFQELNVQTPFTMLILDTIPTNNNFANIDGPKLQFQFADSEQPLVLTREVFDNLENISTVQFRHYLTSIWIYIIGGLVLLLLSLVVFILYIKSIQKRRGDFTLSKSKSVELDIDVIEMKKKYSEDIKKKNMYHK